MTMDKLKKDSPEIEMYANITDKTADFHQDESTQYSTVITVSFINIKFKLCTGNKIELVNTYH